MIKTLSKVGTEGIFINIIQTIYDKLPTSYSMGRNYKHFP